MPEFLTNVLARGPIIPIEALIRLLLALLMGFAVSWIYRSTRDKDSITSSFPTTLILLCVLIAMVTQVIGDSVARAFSLVGALSIVRFRTVVRETQDTAYVMFAVIVGMAVGANDLSVAIIGIVVVGIAALLTMPRKSLALQSMEAQPDFVLSVVVGLGTDLQILTPICDRYAGKRHLRSFRTVKQGAALEAVYEVTMRQGASPLELVQNLNQLDGIQGVEIERPGVFEE